MRARDSEKEDLYKSVMVLMRCRMLFHIEAGIKFTHVLGSKIYLYLIYRRSLSSRGTHSSIQLLVICSDVLLRSDLVSEVIHVIRIRTYQIDRTTSSKNLINGGLATLTDLLLQHNVFTVY